MAYTTINKPTDYFNTKLWTGNGSTQSITGVGFQPDFTWGKSRSASYSVGYHILSDVVRGVTKSINSNNNSVEITSTNLFTSFNSDGFTVGDNAALNASTDTSVAWNWKANGAGSSNTDGSITSTVSANTTSGFSIVKYTGTGSNATVGHGLGVAPRMIIIKSLGTGENWLVGGTNISSNWSSSLHLDTTASIDTFNYWQNYAPTTNYFYMTGDAALNQNTQDYIAYCFSDVRGYSKFSSYTGNGDSDGPFIYTGFKPAFFLVKRSSDAETWLMYDNKRLGYNDYNNYLSPDSGNGESTGHGGNGAIDILSNGIKIRGTVNGTNSSGSTYIYMAFAEAPLVGTNDIPASAR